MRQSMCYLAVLLSSTSSMAAPDKPASMKFDEVREVAPGVFFRYSAISATDKNVVFGGSNNVWVVFEDYVVVIDANFPKEAGDVIAAIKKTTDKPIRYVFDTHHHGDHAYGNNVFAEQGAQVIAQTHCARLLRVDGPREFAEAGLGATGRPDIAASKLKVPNIVFDDKLVLEDKAQRIEFLFLGHGHTPGDAVAYLPRHKILCTGDACVNGAFNYMGHSDSASWIRALERMKGLGPKLICPGHGQIAGPELLDQQQRYFVDLRDTVRKGIEARQSDTDIADHIDLPWYKEWTGVKPAGDNVKHVYAELTGNITPPEFLTDLHFLESPSPSPSPKSSPGWIKPQRIVVPAGLMPARIAELKLVAPEIEFVPAKNLEKAMELAADADGIVGFSSRQLPQVGKRLRWIQTEADTDLVSTPELVVTNTRGASGPTLAEHALGLLLNLVGRVESASELRGRSMVVVGHKRNGWPIGRLAHALGMRVRLVDSVAEKPDFAISLHKPDQLVGLLAGADVIVLAPQAGKATLIGAKELQQLKPSAYLISVGNVGVVDLGAVGRAIADRKMAGVGIELAEGLPKDHPLLGNPAALITHDAGNSPQAQERRWQILRDNVRRFAVGEPLLCVVEATR